MRPHVTRIFLFNEGHHSSEEASHRMGKKSISATPLTEGYYPDYTRNSNKQIPKSNSTENVCKELNRELSSDATQLAEKYFF